MTSDRMSSQERREFFRINFNTPLQFKSYAGDRQVTSRSDILKGTSQNISQSGILFQTDNNPPQLSSILWMDVDLRTLKICQEIEQRAIVFNNGVLGRVVRVEENPKSNAYEIGVCFITQDQENDSEVQGVMAKIGK